ncbi:MAG: AAA family ATPase, partial [Anaerolineales bacterium]
MFLRFEGIDYEHDEDAEAKLDRYIRWVQEVLARYDGSLLQVTIGDKGSYLYAAFGAPTAHEDDLRCAVSAALDLRENPQAIPYLRPPQIGLSQGIMRAGAAGGTTRRTYGVLGDEVNLAARLMGKAALGQILASQQMARAAAHLYEFKDLGPIAIKGRREAIPVFEVLGRRRATPGKDVTGRMGARVVGRVAEQTLLAEQLQALRGGDTHAVIIQGEPGIGKSFLVERLVEQAQALEVTVLSGAADAIEQSTAYYAWRPVFRAVFGLGEMEDATLIRQHVFKQLEADATLLERAPLLNAVLPLDLPDNELTAQMAGEVRSNNTLDVLVRLLQRTVAQSPVLVILEGAHWLDSA